MKKKLVVGLSTLLLVGLVGCGQKAVEKPVTETKKTDEQVVKESSSKEKEETAQLKIANIEEIISIYQKQFPNTDITSIQLEKEIKGFVYQVEGVDDESEYELKMNAETKDVLNEKINKLDRDEQAGVKRKADKLDLTELISVDKATEIAEKEAVTGQAVEWDLDRELNTTYWKVTVQDGKKETKIKLDAKSGEILEVELED